MPTACIRTLGCPKNSVESELFAGIFSRAGWAVSDDPESSDLLLLNTCAFIAPAVEESLEAFYQAEEWRNRRVGRRLVLAGCLPGRFRDDGSGGLESVDLLLLPGEFSRLSGYLGTQGGPCGQLPLEGRILRYLRIADGCDNRCAYCTIPSIRGPFRPERRETILARAGEMVESGASEIGLVAQDSSMWRDGGTGLVQLADELAGTWESVWWRLYYIHPAHFPEELPGLFARRHNVMPWLDLPVQHSSGDLLRRMGRPYGREKLERILDLVDSEGLDIALRATVIAGYPGEGDADFDDLCEFLSGARALRSLVAFPYYDEEGTLEHSRAASRIPGDVTAYRLSVLGSIGDAAAAAWAARLGLGPLEVLAETSRTGHGRFDAPAVDGRCTFSRRVTPGKVYSCRVDEFTGLDMTVTPAPRGIDRAPRPSDASCQTRSKEDG